MSIGSPISDFIERIKAADGSDQSIVGILTAHGWPEKEVYEALAAYYARTTGMDIPRRESTATAAKDAFFYLVIFSTLATWTIGFGSLAFSLIDRWLADALFQASYNVGYESYSIAQSLASVLVAFPIYLLVSRAVVRDVARHPQKLNSPVRKWLTYMALVIAAGVLVGDLITTLAYFLRGEITSRFLAKAFVVLLLSGGVFYYYFGGLKKGEQLQANDGLGRDAWMAMLSGAAVLILAILGFWSLGSPRSQRMLRADNKRVQDLYQISQAIKTQWDSSGHQLPQHLDQVSGVASSDPVTRVAYDYHMIDQSHYELCATFSLESEKRGAASRSIWTHPAGHYCFALNAEVNADNPYIYTPY
jgi:Domain of unknown function (DUF5671)